MRHLRSFFKNFYFFAIFTFVLPLCIGETYLHAQSLIHGQVQVANPHIGIVNIYPTEFSHISALTVSYYSTDAKNMMSSYIKNSLWFNQCNWEMLSKSKTPEHLKNALYLCYKKSINTNLSHGILFHSDTAHNAIHSYSMSFSHSLLLDKIQDLLTLHNIFFNQLEEISHMHYLKCIQNLRLHDVKYKSFDSLKLNKCLKIKDNVKIYPNVNVIISISGNFVTSHIISVIDKFTQNASSKNLVPQITSSMAEIKPEIMSEKIDTNLKISMFLAQLTFQDIYISQNTHGGKKLSTGISR